MILDWGRVEAHNITTNMFSGEPSWMEYSNLLGRVCICIQTAMRQPVTESGVSWYVVFQASNCTVPQEQAQRNLNNHMKYNNYHCSRCTGPLKVRSSSSSPRRSGNRSEMEGVAVRDNKVSQCPLIPQRLRSSFSQHQTETLSMLQQCARLANKLAYDCSSPMSLCKQFMTPTMGSRERQARKSPKGKAELKLPIPVPKKTKSGREPIQIPSWTRVTTNKTYLPRAESKSEWESKDYEKRESPNVRHCGRKESCLHDIKWRRRGQQSILKNAKIDIAIEKHDQPTTVDYNTKFKNLLMATAFRTKPMYNVQIGIEMTKALLHHIALLKDTEGKQNFIYKDDPTSQWEHLLTRLKPLQMIAKSKEARKPQIKNGLVVHMGVLQGWVLFEVGQVSEVNFLLWITSTAKFIERIFCIQHKMASKFSAPVNILEMKRKAIITAIFWHAALIDELNKQATTWVAISLLFQPSSIHQFLS